jgi:hypothetical protein
MTLELAFALLALPAACAFINWRLGLALCLITAILQDPFRKLTPDQPVIFVVFVGAVFVAACVGASLKGVRLNLNQIFGRYSRISKSLSLLLLLVVIQAANSYVRFESLVVTLIGIMTYVMPLSSMVFAYQVAVKEKAIYVNDCIKWYIVAISCVLTSVVIEYGGYHWPVLGQVGSKLIMYDRTTGAVLTSFTGLFRASEIAAWHAMTAACLVVLTVTAQRTSLVRSLGAGAFAAILIGIGILTGRRKIVIEFAVFVSAYFLLWIVLERKVSRVITIACTTAAIGVYLTLATDVRETRFEPYDPELGVYSSYVARSQSVFNDAPSRFVELGIAPVMWAYDSFGVFGAGLGVGSQGTQHFTSGVTITGAAEGGLGKITVELGIPGLFVMGWLGIAVLRELWRIMRCASQYSVRYGRMSFGLFSLVVANVAGFSVATQAYGDLFILLILSWALGFLFAFPRLIEREVRIRQVRTEELAVGGKLASVLRPKAA